MSNSLKNRTHEPYNTTFFKKAPSNQKIPGTSENAVKIQVYTAIKSYCLVAIMQHYMRQQIHLRITEGPGNIEDKKATLAEKHLMIIKLITLLKVHFGIFSKE